jgi:hypothetical protein
MTGIAHHNYCGYPKEMSERLDCAVAERHPHK